MEEDMGVSASQTGPLAEGGAANASPAKPSVPNAADWHFAKGDIPPVRQHVLVWALGRYGDIYGPLPFEMFAPEAWQGNMLGASHDLVAWAECEADWRDVFPYMARVTSDSGRLPQG